MIPSQVGVASIRRGFAGLSSVPVSWSSARRCHSSMSISSVWVSATAAPPSSWRGSAATLGRVCAHDPFCRSVQGEACEALDGCRAILSRSRRCRLGGASGPAVRVLALPVPSLASWRGLWRRPGGFLGVKWPERLNPAPAASPGRSWPPVLAAPAACAAVRCASGALHPAFDAGCG